MRTNKEISKYFAELLNGAIGQTITHITPQDNLGFWEIGLSDGSTIGIDRFQGDGETRIGLGLIKLNVQAQASPCESDVPNPENKGILETQNSSVEQGVALPRSCSAGRGEVSDIVLREHIECLQNIILESNKEWRENDSKKVWELNQTANFK